MSQKMEQAWAEDRPCLEHSRVARKLLQLRRSIETTAQRYGQMAVDLSDVRELDRLRREYVRLDGHLPSWVEDEFGPLKAKYWIVNDNGTERMCPLEPNGLHLTVWQFGSYELTATFSRIEFERMEMKSDRKRAPQDRPIRHRLSPVPIPPPHGGFEFYIELSGQPLSALWVRPAIYGGV
mgnify:CR=1 FL=1